MLDVTTIETPSLGDRSYVVSDGEVAVVVDPQRDHDRVLEVVADKGLRLTHVLETHIHNDYLTGGCTLARETGAAYCVNAADDVSFEREPVSDGDELRTGRLVIRVMATPGHTFTHLSYVVSEDGSDEDPVVFSGGSLLLGATGRPDLLGPEHTRELAGLQHASAHRLVEELPDGSPLYPTHGFGSFCSASSIQEDADTIGAQRTANSALTTPVEQWVEDTLAALTEYPAYYARMAPANASGPGPVDLEPPAEADPEQLRRRIEAGEWVVDLRSRTAYAAGHVPGSLSFGQDGSFIGYLGWLLPWGTPVTLLAETPEELEEAQRDLARIGIDRPAAAADGELDTWLGSSDPATLRRVGFSDVAAADGGMRVLDVRRDDERRAGYVEGSVHIPLHQLLERMDEVPQAEVWVHCASGYRASIAAGLLDRAGVDVVLIDDEYENAEKAGLTTDADEG